MPPLDKPPGGPGSPRPRFSGTRDGRRPAWILGLLGLTLGPWACAPDRVLKPVVPARGEVTIDGKPGSGLLVVFHPTDDPVPNDLDPRAIVEPDGTFAVSTHNARDGAPPGHYRVTVHDPNASGPSPEEGGPSAASSTTRPRLPARYADPGRSGLEATVRPDSPNGFPFRLTR